MHLNRPKFQNTNTSINVESSMKREDLIVPLLLYAPPIMTSHYDVSKLSKLVKSDPKVSIKLIQLISTTEIERPKSSGSGRVLDSGPK